MNATDIETSRRLTALEELSAHQARTIDELSSELANQWTTIGQLQKRLEHLIDRFVSLEQASLDAPAITKPPHY